MPDDPVKQLVLQLNESSHLKKHGKSTKIECTVFNRPDVKVDSWKFNEWDYGKSKIALPCNARGLFITSDEDSPRIVARGYDKFFNIDEVPSTTWNSIESNTEGPYEITVKENGCIILISGLEDGSIVVCSKHSTGPRDDTNRNHALAGQTFLQAQLKEQNIDISKLAKELYETNCTAVAEYCDDSFEQHILEYGKDRAGLYLHGLNYNEPQFKTKSMKEVEKFADKWGFRHIEYFLKNDASSLKIFLDECSKNGHFNNQEIEGFVIRCREKSGSAFFFKFKFKEPYLMYRQWREVTRDYILKKIRTFRFRSHNFITNKYMDFVVPILDNDPTIAERYLLGDGIIELRKQFLKNFGMTGLEILNSEKIKQFEKEHEVNYNSVDQNTKFLLVPIATIGCGKTTVSQVLKNLFPDSWAHIQNDNITGKDKSQYIKQALQQFKDGKKCVIADKNNHQLRERQELFNWLSQYKEDYVAYDCNIQVIALCFINEISDEFKSLTIERVLRRGDNHQSIKSEKYGDKKVLSIMQGFINRFQPFDSTRNPDKLFDYHIDLKVEKESSLKNAIFTLQSLKEHYGNVIPDVPDEKSLNAALEKALSYKPEITKVIKTKRNESHYSPVYFSANIEQPLKMIEVMKNIISDKFDQQPELQRIFSKGILKNEFHITLCHKSQLKHSGIQAKQLWSKYLNRYNNYLCKDITPKKSLIITDDIVLFRLKDIIWDKHVVLATIELPNNAFVNKAGEPIEDIYCNVKFPHITLALLGDQKKPVYAGELAAEVYDFGIEAVLGARKLSIECEIEYVAQICINL